MIETLAAETATLQNVYAPLPFKVHMIFCVIATLLYITQFIRKGSYHYLTLMIAIDLTIVTQFTTKSFVIGMLFGAEAALLAATALFPIGLLKAESLEECRGKSETAQRKMKNENSYT